MMQAEIEQVLVHSFDFDGSLNHKPYIEDKKKFKADFNLMPSMVDANRPFLDLLKKRGSSYHKVVTLIGSNRQSHHVDQKGIALNGEVCFPYYQAISAYLNAQFCPMLMADIYNNLPIGFSFERSLAHQGASVKIVHPDTKPDQVKIVLLFSQMQEMAKQYPKANITFHFYDDLPGLLTLLHEYYSEHADLIPKNVQLCLFHYHNGLVPLTSLDPIKGTGDALPNYPKHANALQLKVEDEIAQRKPDLKPVRATLKAMQSYQEHMAAHSMAHTKRALVAETAAANALFWSASPANALTKPDDNKNASMPVLAGVPGP